MDWERGMGRGTCGKCISCEVEVRLKEGCWFCIAVTRQVWNVASRFCLAYKCESSVIQPLIIRRYKKQRMGKGGSLLRLQNALLCRNTHSSCKLCVCVCVLTDCRLKCKILTHIQMSVCVWQLFRYSNLSFTIPSVSHAVSNQHKSHPLPFFVCVLTTNCVQAPLHNSLATALALVHTHPSS